MSTIALTDHTGARIVLGRKLSEGGEGAVYEVARRSDIVAKLYTSRVPRDATEKLPVLVSIADDWLKANTAWPLSVLYEGCLVRGFTMPSISPLHEIHDLFGPRRRHAIFPEATWRYLVHCGANLALLFMNMHGRGIMVGDVNSRNVVAQHKAVLKLLDCDSVQVATATRIYRCHVGVPEYQPPEVQGKAFGSFDRTPEQDLFGLAILIFQVLFMGRHPFAGIPPVGAAGSDIAENIKAGYYFYGRDARVKQLRPPPGAPMPSIATQEIVEGFERAFLGQPQSRPTAQWWRDALIRLEQTVVQCKANEAHWHLPGLSKCPWCWLDGQSGFAYFVLGSPENGDQRDFWLVIRDEEFDNLWRQIEGIRLSPLPIPLSSGTPTRFRGNPAPPELRGRAICFPVAVLLAIASGFALLTHFGMPGVLVGALLLFISFRIKPDAREEFARRKSIQLRAQDALEDAQRRLDQAANRWHSKKRYEDLRSAYKRAKQQRDDFKRQYIKLENQRKNDQLRAFLEQFEIHDADIDNIKEKRKAILLSFGIETAADITEARVSSIPGFGPTLTRNLMKWRRSKEQRFRFDASKPIDPAALRSLHAKFLQERKQLLARLQAGVIDLQQTAAGEEREHGELIRALNKLQRDLLQAEADVRVLDWRYRR